jgi:energy-coupling factor transporter ATP-binding protein EcfA2
MSVNGYDDWPTQQQRRMAMTHARRPEGIPQAGGLFVPEWTPRADPELEMRARLSRDAPRVPWDVFLRDKLRWNPGEHFALIGPTGQGKTTMLLNLLPQQRYITVFATKPRDETMESLINTGYLKMERWRSLDPRDYPRRVLWPDASTIDSESHQKAVFQHAFAAIYREGGWTVALDETWYMANILNLGGAIKLYLLQARALGISLLCATQRPAHVPLEIYDQSSHLMFWRDNDEANLRRLSGISWRSADLIRRIVSNLDRHQVLYINTRTGEMLRTRCPAVTLSTGGR